MTFGKSLLLSIPLLFSGIFVVASPTSAATTTVPTQITSATDWTTVSAGSSHTCATRGKLYCWGSDGHGQLGNGSGGSTTVPRQITTATDWKAVSAGTTHTCATRGKLYCWGHDGSGQLGNGSGGSTTVPTQITTATDWTTVSAGTTHTCATRGKLYCWGSDGHGQLGNGSGDSTTVPRQITTAADWKAIAAGTTHTCATRGKLYCWGVPQAQPDCPTDSPTNDFANEPWPTLSYWKLTTPIDANNDGKADEVTQNSSPPLRDLDDQDYFDRPSASSIRFRAATTGATTSGSSFPRSELREMTQDGSYEAAAWNGKCGTHRMTIAQAITAQPARANPEDPVVAGQIHDGGGDAGNGDVAMIRLEGKQAAKRLFVEADGYDKADNALTLDSTYQLGQEFKVTITVSASGIRFEYNNSVSGSSTTVGPLAPALDNMTWFFKAGVYTQACYPQSATCASNRVGTGAGEVVIYDLNVTHS